MLRTIKIGSVLAATTAALTLAIAAPASADGVGAQAVIGTAFTNTNFVGVTGVLESGRNTCTDIPNMGSALSAINLPASGSTITLYSDATCTTLSTPATLAPGAMAANISPQAVAYKST